MGAINWIIIGGILYSVCLSKVEAVCNTNSLEVFATVSRQSEITLPPNIPNTQRWLHRSGIPSVIADKGLKTGFSIVSTATPGNGIEFGYGIRSENDADNDHRFDSLSVVVIEIPMEINRMYQSTSLQYRVPGVVPMQYVRGYFDHTKGFLWTPNPNFDQSFRPELAPLQPIRIGASQTARPIQIPSEADQGQETEDFW